MWIDSFADFLNRMYFVYAPVFADRDKSSCRCDDGIKGDGFQSAASIDVSIIQPYALISIWTNMAPLFTQPWAEHLTYIDKAACEELPGPAGEDVHSVCWPPAPFHLYSYCQPLKL